MPTMAAPLSPVAGGCWIYKIALSVALTVLVLLVFAALIVIIRWRLRKSRINRRCQKASGMITIGRARDRRNPVGEIKVTSGMLNNNNRPTLNAIHETNSCPVVIPTINVIANDDKTESMTSQDMTYAHIRRSKARGQSRLASPLSRASKPSGEYADLIDTLDQESISSKPKPSPALGASTPVGLGNPGKRNPNTEETYISPVQYRVPNLVDSAEVFDNDRGFRNRLASAFTAIPRRISSTFSALGSSLPAVTPSNSPRLTSSGNDAMYLSFHDGSGLTPGSRTDGKQ